MCRFCLLYKQKRHLSDFSKRCQNEKGHRYDRTCAFYLRTNENLKQRFGVGLYDIVLFVCGFTIEFIIAIASFTCFKLFSVP